MTQKQIVIQAVDGQEKSIDDVVAETGILRPNIRRILGQGVKSGIFRRIARGVYTLTTETGEQRAYIRTGYAQDVLPELVAAGKKFDMIFLDPAYYSPAIIGSNRCKIKNFYQFIMPDAFLTVMQSVTQLLRTSRSHVYLMLSGARTAQPDMQKYIDCALMSGLKIVGEGKYSKTYSNGKPVINVRGEEAAAERLILLTRSGKAINVSGEVVLDFRVERPNVKGNYRTQKAADFVDTLIEQSTWEDNEVGDFFAGSGIVVERALLLNRKVTAIEVSDDAVDNYIIPKVNAII